MGVHGLWKILESTAIPIKLETLKGKVLAIDASIWIYHFLKAMRDPQGTVLTAAHIIGFFRRICKLIFYEIKPVFVFDGSSPILKKQTTKKRSERRLGREQSARSTANRLLTIQLQRAAVKAVDNAQSTNFIGNVEIIGKVPEGAKYLENSTTDNPKQRQPKQFIKTDQYHLPEMGNIGPIRADDQRMLSQEELDEYSKQFTNQARGGFIDTSLVDFQAKEFQHLPIETQYQLLNMARLKSRLRMGYTAEELNEMFPNQMDFSRFQINRVAQRNFFTQKLMNLVGMDENPTRRVSSEKNKEYFLKKTSQGWSLSLEDRHSSKSSQGDASITKELEEESDDAEVEFEDVDLKPTIAKDTEQWVNFVDETVPKQSTECNESERQSKSSIVLNPDDSNMLGELFGFEAKLSRQNLYEKVLSAAKPDDEENEEDYHKSQKPFGSLGQTKKISPKNVDGGVESHNDRVVDKVHAPREIPEVPWFKDSNDDFREIRMKDRVENPHFVSTEDYQNDFEEQSMPNEEGLSLHDPELELHADSTGNPANLQPYNHLAEPKISHNKDLESGKTVEKDKIPEPVLKKPSDEQNKDSVEAETLHHPIQLSPEAVERAEEEAREDEDENEDIAGMLIAEAEENERFARELANQSNKTWSQRDENDYQQQVIQLRQQFAMESRDADNVSTEMIQECQELLQLFGIPYITAPGEAEAQCGELHHLGLVDGVVTDDGDTFLFDNDAAVYRNMFSQAKFVEFYSSKSISERLGLDRRKLIDLAFLLGSDYTDGVLGIGPVTGVEILAEFGNLEKFVAWWNEAQRFPDNVDTSSSLRRRLLKSFRSKLFFNEDFPSPSVIDAYLNPSVDKENSKFKWGVPDLDGIRKYLSIATGWDVDKIDATLLPVVQDKRRRDLLKKTEKVSSQTLLEDYYHDVVQNPNLGSKRTAQATAVLRKRSKNSK